MNSHQANPNTSIAVDVMGSDGGVSCLVEGGLKASSEFGVSVVFVGRGEEIQSALLALGARTAEHQVVNAPDVVGMDESPGRAIVQKPDASICVAYDLLERGEVTGLISAGNSGAMMAAGIRRCGTLPGIKRPAIAALIPRVGSKPPCILLDSGANVECQAFNLVQFAVMGSVYCRTLCDLAEPKVALLSNGSEPNKGTQMVREAAQALGAVAACDYIGFVEGRDIGRSEADVVVCDGFVGNIVLKTMEGCVQLIGQQLDHECRTGPRRRLVRWLGEDIYESVFRQRFDYTAYGGAPLLGLRKLAVVLHGASDVRAVANAIRITHRFAEEQMTSAIGAQLEEIEAASLAELPGSISPMLPGGAGFGTEAKRATRRKAKKDQTTEGESS